MKDCRSAEEVQQANWEHFIERGSGLSFGYGQYVAARRPATGEILLGGLGGMGMGRMWFPEESHHADYPGYDDAEIVA